ncbi:Neuropeptide-Like Protein [Ditylenchus destructor]|uniref:Neuropeptide-Like Protein n=1 Tax=Ditylenchus destructor TaxID=166010 RepID=A0AAD4NFF5_9BILA|nr:Neuropeptide-Like Protein [Ditylenchus destructor]
MSAIRRKSASFVSLTFLFTALYVCLLCLPTITSADPSSLFFRQPKWTNLPPSGGSLVSGRGNFRPGFYSRGASYDPSVFLSEPSFGFSKRSQNVHWPSDNV